MLNACLFSRFLFFFFLASAGRVYSSIYRAHRSGTEQPRNYYERRVRTPCVRVGCCLFALADVFPRRLLLSRRDICHGEDSASSATRAGTLVCGLSA